MSFISKSRTNPRQAGAIFILDEVMTSRLSGGGLAHMHGLKPDLKTFGKWLGGGLAFGAFGGRADVMAAFDPRLSTSVSHSGTFNNNTLVTHAGYVGLTQLYTPDHADTFTKVGEQFRDRLNEVAQGTKMCFTGVGTAMAVHITESGTRDILRADDIVDIQDLMDLFWYEMTEQGFWIARRGFMAMIWGTPQEELDRYVAAVGKFVEDHREFLSL